MKQVDLLVYNGSVLTMDDQNSIIENGFVCVRNGRISHLGGGTPEALDSAARIDARGGLIMPGLVNAHTHAAMSLFRGLADDLPLMTWLNDYIFPVESRMDEDFVYVGTRLACAEMMLAGTTTFCDMYLFEDAVAQAAQASGMRCLVGEVLYDFPSPNYGEITQGFAYAEHMIEKWRSEELVSVAIEPHSLYTCSPELLTQADELARRHRAPLIIHLAESQTEIQTVLDRYGKRPVAHLADLGLLNERLIADHCVYLNSDEISLLAERGVRVVHNPESNMKLASGVAPIPDLLAAGVTVGLGTDGCASNNNLDLFTEMDTAAKLPKVHRLDPTALEAVTVVRMATIEGARALGMAHDIGSLELGKCADLIVIDTEQPHLTPLYNPYSQIVYAARGSDVRHVFINGRQVVEDRRLLSIDLAQLQRQVASKADLVRRWLSL